MKFVRGLATTWLATTWLAAIAVGVSAPAQATGYKDDVGYTKLLQELGVSIPTGAGVPVAQTEAPDGSGNYLPDTANSQFTISPGKTFATRGPSSGASSHANTVGLNFYGGSASNLINLGAASSMAPGITHIENYNASYWVGSGDGSWSVLNTRDQTRDPLVSPQASRVGNHSWVGTFGNTNTDLDASMRLDWLVEEDDFIQVVGVNNGGTVQPLLASSLNAIAVGITGGNHAMGTTALQSGVGAVYVAGRTKPDLVAPRGATSYATPVVGAAAAMLIQYGHSNPANSLVSYLSPRTGTTIYSAETSEVIKAALLAGSSRLAFSSQDSQWAIVDYRLAGTNQTTNGMDRRFGAGQLNVRNSYYILAGGEQNSQERSGPASIAPAGFDYESAFGGLKRSPTTATYNFQGEWTGQLLTACLAWNADVNITKVESYDYANAAALYRMDLNLLDLTDPARNVTIASTIDNTQNLAVELIQGHQYQMQVVRDPSQSAFQWQYGLAWTRATTMGWTGASTNMWIDSISGPLNWIKGATATIYGNAEDVVFADGPTQTAVQITGTVTPSSVLVNNSAKDYTFSGGAIAGATGIVKRGSGTLTLAAPNTYTGITAIQAGMLNLGNQNAVQNSTITMAGGSLVFDQSVSGNAFTFGGLAASSSGTGYNIALQNNATTPAAISLTVGGNNTSTIYAGVLSGSGSLTKIGTGALTLSGANTYTGITAINAGKLNLSNQNAMQNSTITMAGGSLVFDQSVSGNAFTFGGLAASSSGAGYNIALQNNATTPAAISLTVGGNNTSTIYAGVLSGSGSLTKIGTGALTLSGTNNYTGLTTVNAGTLIVGAAGVGSIASAVTVEDTTTLGGTGTIGGLVTVKLGGILSPGDSVGTLTINNNLTLASGGKCVVDVFGSTADRVAIAGDLNLTGAALEFSISALDRFQAGTYTLATYTGALTGTFASVTNLGAYVFDTGLNYGTGINSAITLTLLAGLVPGDANLDRITNFSDYGTVATHYNQTSAKWTDGDVNGDGVVNFSDYSVIAGSYGSTAGIGSPIVLQGVPEPGTLVLLATGLLGLLAWAWRRRA